MRSGSGGFERVLHRDSCARSSAVRLRMESSVLDLAYLLGVLALFLVIGLAARGVEKLGPPVRAVDPRAARESEESR